MSCGNYACVAVIKGSVAEATLKETGKCEIKPFDVVHFPNWTLKEHGKQNSKIDFFVILHGIYKVVKTGLTSPIGNPRNYYD